ncbi:hypothetical protein [Paenibacillus pasadenensis]|uniref:hypothetical protein n=1 Tax=Paenibacillus pasadenensis TaxID=217090 RepID=UPI000C7E0F10|nr:hypothetical protein [Paenibacillus pasadenensis]
MGLIRDLWNETVRFRTVTATLPRSEYYKLQLICDSINDHTDVEYEVTPDMIAERVLQTFISEAYEDGTSRLIRRLLPEVSRQRKR